MACLFKVVEKAVWGLVSDTCVTVAAGFICRLKRMKIQSQVYLWLFAGGAFARCPLVNVDVNGSLWSNQEGSVPQLIQGQFCHLHLWSTALNMFWGTDSLLDGRMETETLWDVSKGGRMFKLNSSDVGRVWASWGLMVHYDAMTSLSVMAAVATAPRTPEPPADQSQAPERSLWTRTVNLPTSALPWVSRRIHGPQTAPRSLRSEFISSGCSFPSS